MGGRTGRRRAAGPARGGFRFAFYGRVSTEDWQDPVTSRARQRDQAAALVAGHGRMVAEFFDVGYSRALAWARRPQAAALVAAPLAGTSTWPGDRQPFDVLVIAHADYGMKWDRRPVRVVFDD